MNGFTTLLKKELKHYFNSPIAYVILVAFLVLAGWYFIFPLFFIKQASTERMFQIFPYLFMFIIPAISMRLIAEEKKQGTLELLETYPITDLQIITAKITAGLIFFAFALLLTLLFPILVSTIGPLEWGVVASSIIGALLLSAAMLSYGMFFSSITKNQIVAFIISLVISIVLIFTNFFAELFANVAASFLGFFSLSDANTVSSITSFINFFGFESHYSSFLRGVIDMRDFVYFASIIAIGIVLTKESLEFRHN